VIWCLRHPGELRAWAEKTWKDKPMPKHMWGKRRPKPRARNDVASDGLINGSGDEWDDDGGGLLRWEDVVDWDTWPKSTPDWSDLSRSKFLDRVGISRQGRESIEI
jgi:hypothetical protein